MAADRRPLTQVGVLPTPTGRRHSQGSPPPWVSLTSSRCGAVATRVLGGWLEGGQRAVESRAPGGQLPYLSCGAG